MFNNKTIILQILNIKQLIIFIIISVLFMDTNAKVINV